MISPRPAAIEQAGTNDLPNPNPNDGMQEPDESMSHVSDFVASLTDEEFAFLKSEIDARERGERDSQMKSADEVEIDLETLEDAKGSTRNNSME